MNEQQALLILKSVLDLATQKGCFENLQAANTAASAFNVISKKIVSETVLQGGTGTPNNNAG